jgi:hypothetical protein
MRFTGVMAFAECSVPMRGNAYRAALAFPALLLGILPVIWGLAAGSAWLTAYGTFALAGTLGDGKVLWKLRRVPRDSAVMFRPDLGGYEVSEARSLHAGVEDHRETSSGRS